MTLSLERINKAREAGYDDDKILESIQRKDPEFGARIQKARQSGYDSKKIMQSIENRLNTPAPQQNTQANSPGIPDSSKVNAKETPKQNSLIQSFEKGLKESASGELSKQVFGSKSKEEITQDPSFWEQLAQSGGSIAGDLPYMLAGGSLGAAIGSVGGPVGSLVGGGFGSLALPTFMKEALKEYREHQEKGNDITFGEFLSQADRVASKTLKEGAFGVILGTINKAMPLLTQIPGVEKLFTSKAAQKAVGITAETGAIATIPPLTEGRLPEGKDYAHALALVLGFNATKLPSAIRERIQKQGESSGKTPEEFAKGLPRDEIIEISKLLNKEPEVATKDLASRGAKILESTEKSKTRNQAQKINIETDVPKTEALIEALPKSNKKNLAVRALKENYIRTPEDLSLFLDEYETIYPSLPGKTGLSKNRKFMNRFASAPEFKISNAEPVTDITPTPERTLQIGRIQKREGRLSGDKQKSKEAQKRIDLSKRKIKNQANQKTEKVEPTKESVKSKAEHSEKITFKTEKGSTYEVNEDGSTIRNKAYRAEHGNSEQGPQKPSEKTRYITPEDANKLGEFQVKGGGDKKIFQYPDGRLAVLYIGGPSAGKVEARTVVESKDSPAEGLIPVETWQDGKKVHFGNKIVSVKSKEFTASKPKQTKPLEPITETTGQGANERVEWEKSLPEKVKETVKSGVETAKNPSELKHQITTKAFNALAPIERLETDIPVSERVSTKIKQAQNSASDINNILTKGIFDNVTNTFDNASLSSVYGETGLWRKLSKGLKPQEFSVQDFDIYRTSKESLKRQKQGKKSGIDTGIAEKDVSRLKQKYGPVEQRLRQFQTKTISHYGKDLLAPEVRDQWSQNAHASLYRVMDYGKDSYVKEGSLAPKKPWFKAKGSGRKILPPSESDIQNLSMLVTNSKKNDSVLQYKKLVESGELPGKIIKSKNKEIPSKMMEELDIDPDSKALAETLYNQSRKDSFTPEKGRIKGWENGKPFEIEVPDDVYDTYSSLAPSDTGIFTNAFKVTNRMLSKGVVLEPRKALSIVGRDALSSLIYSKTGSNPLSIVKAFTEIMQDSHAWNQYKSLGGDQYSARLMTRAERSAKISDLIKERPNAIIVPFKQLGKFLSKVNESLSASVPFAEYQRALKVYGDTPTGRLQAMVESKSVTYDVNKKGSSKLIKGIADVSPFFNTMLQEPGMIAKNITRPLFLAKGFTAITLPSLLLKFYNEGNPDYDDLNPLMKASFWHFYAGDKHFACPIPWLLGATFKAAPEALYDVVRGMGGDSAKGLLSYVVSQLTGSVPPILQAVVEQSTGKSLPSPSPLGLAISPFVDVETRAPDVVPRRLQNLPPEQQYTSRTSQLARWYGGLTNSSPVKVERLIKTFGGGLAADGLALADEMAYATGLAEDLRPEQGSTNFLFFGNWISNSTPQQTKYTNQFYSLLEEAKLDKQRDKPNSDTKILQTYNRKISAKFKDYRQIELSKTDQKSKKEKLLTKQKEINALYKEAVEKVKK